MQAKHFTTTLILVAEVEYDYSHRRVHTYSLGIILVSGKVQMQKQYPYECKSAVGTKALPIGKKNIKNLINIRMFIICPSVLRPDLASKKKRWQDPTKHKNIKT